MFIDIVTAQHANQGDLLDANPKVYSSPPTIVDVASRLVGMTVVTKVLSKWDQVARAEGRRIECGAKLCVFRSRNGVFLMDCDAKKLGGGENRYF